MKVKLPTKIKKNPVLEAVYKPHVIEKEKKGVEGRGGGKKTAREDGGVSDFTALEGKEL